MSLDDSDSHAGTFWLYVVAALHSAAPGIGAGALPLLAAGQPPTREMLTAVLNEIGDQSNDVDLILDDYHLADSPEVAEGMTFLLDRRPANLHVVVSTRADPDLPLARLRAHGELVEIRARDLRFTVDETASYLTDVGGLPVAPADVSALESRTEGWAAALQLVSLSMQGRDDTGDFIAGFAGTDRYIVDYLADEVLSRQSDEVRDFLERTSILDVLSGDLCDSVLERAGSRAMLERLERANLFLVPLDDQRTWYRYHHLFADVLQARLHSERPHVVPGLHLRASLLVRKGWRPRCGRPMRAGRGRRRPSCRSRRGGRLPRCSAPGAGDHAGGAGSTTCRTRWSGIARSSRSPSSARSCRATSSATSNGALPTSNASFPRSTRDSTRTTQTVHDSPGRGA